MFKRELLDSVAMIESQDFVALVTDPLLLLEPRGNLTTLDNEIFGTYFAFLLTKSADILTFGN